MIEEGATPSSHGYRVKVFGVQAQRVGARDVEVRLADRSSTAATVLDAVAEQHPQLASSRPVTRLAVNQTIAEDTDEVTPADELALIGLIGGG